MKRVGVREFKARVPELVREVQETGVPVIITRRGKPVVLLEPYGEDQLWEDAMKDSDEDEQSRGNERRNV